MSGIDEHGPRDRAAEALFAGTGRSRGRARMIDWSATPLGPVHRWPQSLRTAVDICLGSHFPTALLWGPELVLIHNDAHIPILGSRYPDAMGRAARDVLGDTWPVLGPLVIRTLAPGEDGEAAAPNPIDLAVTFDRGGRPRPGYLTVSFSAVRDEAGRSAGVLIAAVDMTARALAEEASSARETFLLTLSDAIAPLGDAEAIRLTAASVLGRYLGASRVAYAEDCGDGEHYDVTPDYVDGAADAAGRFSYADFGSDLLSDLRAGRTRVQPDVRNDGRLTDAEKRALADCGIGASLNVPLVKEGRLVAFLGVDFATAHEFTAHEIDLVREVAERTWAAVERARAEAALRESEKRYRTLFESMSQGYCYVELVRDANGTVVDQRYLDLNPAVERLFGTSAESARGRTAREVFGNISSWWNEAYDRIARGGVPERIEREEPARGIWVDVHVYPRGGDRLVVLYEDVTERKRADLALRESEEQFRRSIEEAPIPVIMHAEDGEVLQISRTWTELTGYTIADVPTLDAWLTRAYGHGADSVREHVHALFSGSKRTMSIDFPVRTLEGEVRHWSFSASAPGTLRDGRSFVVGMALDITERRRAEEALRESEERYRTLVENVHDYAIFMVDPNGTVVEWTSGAERVKGYVADEVLGLHLSLFYTSDDVAAGIPDRELAEAASTGRAEREGWRVRRDGTRFWGNEIATAIRDGQGRLVGFTKICRDLTERKALEVAQQQAHDVLEERVRERTAEVQALFRRLVSAQEEERRRIARDIHDQLGQQMTALRMHISSLASRNAVDPDGADLVARVQQLSAELDESIDFLTWQLRPAALDHLGLPAALAQLVGGWSEQFGIAAEYQSFGADGVRLAPEAESNLYLLTQEALHNIVKHARATHVGVVLGIRDGRLVVAIEDDGVGFDVRTDGASDAGALGLISMRERATLVGGEFEIESVRGQGTTIVVQLPLETP